MFQYTKEVIINSLKADQDAYGSMLEADKVVAKPGILTILRAGEYKIEGVRDRRIYKTPGYTGLFANIAINVTGLFAEGAGIYRFSIYIKSINQYLADYANASWYLFGKPIMVEIEITDPADDAGNAAKLAAALRLAIPYNNLFGRVIETSPTVTVEFTNAYVSIHAATLEYYEPTSCDSCVGHYERLAFNPAITQNREPFATGAWIQENLRFPSYPNLRYSALYADEYPLPNGLYTEYSFVYDVEAIGYYGISAVNQKVEKVTRHVYYVLNTLVDDFEDLVSNAFGDNVIVENNSVIITSGSTVANDGIPVRLVADTYPVVDNAVIEWGPTTGLPTDVTLTEGGVLTAESNAPVGTSFTVTATLTSPTGLSYTAGTKEITIVQG